MKDRDIKVALKELILVDTDAWVRAMDYVAERYGDRIGGYRDDPESCPAEYEAEFHDYADRRGFTFRLDGSIADEPESKKRLVAVYGTLMEGECNHRWAVAAGAEKVAEGLVDGSIYDVGGYPIARLERDGGGLNKIAVEVVEVDDDGIAHMDILEGYPNLYRRETVLVRITESRREDVSVAANALMYIPANPMRWRTAVQIARDGDGVADWRVHARR